jgi:hypothetical protein
VRAVRLGVFLVDADGRAMERSGLVVGHDLHRPGEWLGPTLARLVSPGPASVSASEQHDVLGVGPVFERTVVVPADARPGTYDLILLVGTGPRGDEDLPPADPVGVNLLNRDGFLEVFRLKYGLGWRPVFGRLPPETFQEALQTWDRRAPGAVTEGTATRPFGISQACRIGSVVIAP